MIFWCKIRVVSHETQHRYCVCKTTSELRPPWELSQCLRGLLECSLAWPLSVCNFFVIQEQTIVPLRLGKMWMATPLGLWHNDIGELSWPIRIRPVTNSGLCWPIWNPGVDLEGVLGAQRLIVDGRRILLSGDGWVAIHPRHVATGPKQQFVEPLNILWDTLPSTLMTKPRYSPLQMVKCDSVLSCSNGRRGGGGVPELVYGSLMGTLILMWSLLGQTLMLSRLLWLSGHLCFLITVWTREGPTWWECDCTDASLGLIVLWLGVWVLGYEGNPGNLRYIAMAGKAVRLDQWYHHLISFTALFTITVLCRAQYVIDCTLALASLLVARMWLLLCPEIRYKVWHFHCSVDYQLALVTVVVPPNAESLIRFEAISMCNVTKYGKSLFRK